MLNEVKVFLDTMYPGNDIQPMTMLECAATIQYWREDGVEVPEKLTSSMLCDYLLSRLEEAKKAEKPLKTYEICVTETMQSYYQVEAHNSDEANAIFQAWADSGNYGTIQEDLINNSEGWDYGAAYETEHFSAYPTIYWNEGKELLKGD